MSRLPLPGRPGQHRLECHHVHPRATLDDRFPKAEVNDLANLVFVSARANKRIGASPPKVYFPELEVEELTAHLVPLEESLRDADGYDRFLGARRALLAEAMTALLDRLRPAFLDRLPPAAEPPAGPSMALVLYASAWDPGRLVFTANGTGPPWTGSAPMAELEAAVTAAGDTGFDSDVEIGGESVPVRVVDDTVEVAVGPFLLTGTVPDCRRSSGGSGPTPGR